MTGTILGAGRADTSPERQRREVPVAGAPGRWIGNRERFEPIGEGVPFPTVEELEGKAPYLEVRFERTGDRLSVWFRGRKVASLADRSTWKEAVVRIDAEQARYGSTPLCRKSSGPSRPIRNP